MDRRSQNRKSEHSSHGWADTGKTSELQPGRVLMECPCGWLGWVDEGVREDADLHAER